LKINGVGDHLTVMPEKRGFKKQIIILCMALGSCLPALFSTGYPAHTNIGVTPAVAWFKAGAQDFAVTAAQLQTALQAIDEKHPQTILQARQALAQCRLQYKRIEFFLEYFFRSAAMIYNGPPKYEIEEPYMEYMTPIGLQVIESLLFEKDVAAHQKELLQQAAAINSSAQDMAALLFGFTATDNQLLESVRLQLIRVYTLGITGYDAPLLKTGITESHAVLQGLQNILTPFLQTHAPHADSVKYYLAGCLQLLQANQNFDTFNRLQFLTVYALPLQRNLGLLINELQLQQNTTQGVLNYDAAHLFSKDAINKNAFPADSSTLNTALITLGKTLFTERALSGNNKISCATCHRPELHFTDALPASVAFDGHSHVSRNAPTLLYAAYQYAQFWDGRAKSLEEQVSAVVSNPLEMNGNAANTLQQLQTSKTYRQLFKQAFNDSAITTPGIAAAIAAYVRTLSPFNAPFDQYLAGDTAAMSSAQQRGFNLFMGKAQCGTCHFAPVFNGLVPPLYNFTELEVLGTTRTDDLNKPVADTDQGRFNIFPIEYYQQAFKTPTVRNVSATGPYMHNGAFSTLQSVVEFYNKGGGRGLGLQVPQQTLAAAPLQLSSTEVNDIVSFLHALEDPITN